VGFSLPDRIPEAIEETLLEVCFGEIFLVAEAGPPLFDALVLALVLLAAAGLASALFEGAVLAPLAFADVVLAPPLGAAARAVPVLLFGDAAFVPLLLPPREPVLLPPVLPAIFKPLLSKCALILARQTCRTDCVWQAGGQRAVCGFEECFRGRVPGGS
jgi:hypothetical protein